MKDTLTISYPGFLGAPHTTEAALTVWSTNFSGIGSLYTCRQLWNIIHIYFAIFYIGFFFNGGRREDNWGGEDALEWVHKAVGGQFSHQISLTPATTHLHTAAGKHNALNIWCSTICTLNVFKIFSSALMHACREASKGKYPSVKRYITQKQNCTNHCSCFTVLLQSHQLVMSFWLYVHTTYLLLHSIVGHTLEFLCSVMDILTLIV